MRSLMVYYLEVPNQFFIRQTSRISLLTTTIREMRDLMSEMVLVEEKDGEIESEIVD
jgi:hypothetical protein